MRPTSHSKPKIVFIGRAHPIADGLTVTRPGELNFLIIKALVDGVEVTEEQVILRAVHHYLLEKRLVGGGAAQRCSLSCCL